MCKSNGPGATPWLDVLPNESADYSTFHETPKNPIHIRLPPLVFAQDNCTTETEDYLEKAEDA